MASKGIHFFIIGLILISINFFIVGCSTSPASIIIVSHDRSISNTTMNIDGLVPCHNDATKKVYIDPKLPVTVLVHGCNGSAGSFTSLSRVLTFHGQQSLCFSYNDRDSLESTAKVLNRAANELALELQSKKITVIGHSQGGLIARKSFTDNHMTTPASINLVTVSAPLSGIEKARACASRTIRILSLGIHDLMCWAISGDKWYEITADSEFIRQPGNLSLNVKKYLHISTDERNSCRYFDDEGGCLKSDYVFSLKEQELPLAIDGGITKSIAIQAGHVEIVGNEGRTPRKLIQVLQNEGYINSTSTENRASFEKLLGQLYSSISRKD